MTSYSRRPDHVQAGRAFLISAKDRTKEDLPTYGEFSAVYGGVARAAAFVLNSIARECADRGEPDLSVLVVQRESRLPGMVDGEPVTRDDEKSMRRWQAELQRVRSFRWSSSTPRER